MWIVKYMLKIEDENDDEKGVEWNNIFPLYLRKENWEKNTLNIFLFCGVVKKEAITNGWWGCRNTLAISMAMHRMTNIVGGNFLWPHISKGEWW